MSLSLEEEDEGLWRRFGDSSIITTKILKTQTKTHFQETLTFLIKLTTWRWEEKQARGWRREEEASAMEEEKEEKKEELTTFGLTSH